jgi:hypothetical protein
MNFKTILMALAMGSLVVGGVGCGGTPCDDVTDSADAAAAKAEECGVDLPDAPADDSDAECTITDEQAAVAICSNDCAAAAPCGAWDGTDADAVAALLECVAACG